MSRVVVDHREAVRRLVDRLLGKFRDAIEAIVLYGSVARGEAGRDSDIDLLFIMPESEVSKHVLTVSYDVDLEFGTVTSHIYMTPQEFERNLSWGDPFLDEVLKEGIILHDRGFYSKVRGSLLKKG